MDESTKPLLKDDYQNSRSERKRIKSETIKVKCFSLDSIYKPKNMKNLKNENKFIFKVYLHLLSQTIFLILTVIFAFKLTIFGQIFSNSILFYIFITLAFVLFIYPLMSNQILKEKPYNYIYLVIFTISVCYIICKILLYFEFSTSIIALILFIFELLYLTVDSYLSKRTEMDIGNTIAFIGLCLLFIGSILYFVKKITFFKLIFVILIVLLLGVYLIYDMNLIFLDTRRNFDEKDYVLATIFIYIDIIQTILELIVKFFNSFEPERMPIKKYNKTKSMIYTGDEDYENLYTQKSEKEKKIDEDEDDVIKIKRTNSVKGFKVDSKYIIKEEDENEEEEKGEEIEKGKEDQKKKSRDFDSKIRSNFSSTLIIFDEDQEKDRKKNNSKNSMNI